MWLGLKNQVSRLFHEENNVRDVIPRRHPLSARKRSSITLNDKITWWNIARDLKNSTGFSSLIYLELVFMFLCHSLILNCQRRLFKLVFNILYFQLYRIFINRVHKIIRRTKFLHNFKYFLFFRVILFL